jgi:PhnB protein
MSETTVPKTEVKGGVVTYLQVDGAMKAAEFYKKAFGATIEFAYPPDDKGRTMHVHLYINGSSVMLGDPFPERGHPHKPSQGFTIMIMVDKDIDARFQRAVDAGATVEMPVADMFWGDRYGALRDPFGVSWAMNQPGKGA